MKEFLLICGGIAVFLYLFLLMDRLDHYLCEYKGEKTDSQTNKELKIAVENLEAGGALTCFLKNFSEKYDNYTIKLYYNEKRKILNCLKDKKLDIGFLTGETAKYEDGVFCKGAVRIKNQKLLLENLDVPFIPMKDEEAQLSIFLRMNEQDPQILLFMKEFLHFYQKSFIKQDFYLCKTS